MNNDSTFDFSRPNIDDVTLDRLLDSLPGFDPRAGFENRVMSRVLAPPPRWVLSMKRRARELVDTRRFRWIAAGLLTTSTVSVIVTTALVLTHFSTLSQAVDWTTANVGLPIWRAAVGYASEFARDAFAYSGPLLVSRDMALIAAAAAGAFLVFSAWMLLCLMRPNCLARTK